MNYCNKCQSNYTAPGTCNCFAPIQTLITDGCAVRLNPDGQTDVCRLARLGQACDCHERDGKA